MCFSFIQTCHFWAAHSFLRHHTCLNCCIRVRSGQLISCSWRSLKPDSSPRGLNLSLQQFLNFGTSYLSSSDRLLHRLLLKLVLKSTCFLWFLTLCKGLYCPFGPVFFFCRNFLEFIVDFKLGFRHFTVFASSLIFFPMFFDWICFLYEWCWNVDSIQHFGLLWC